MYAILLLLLLAQAGSARAFAPHPHPLRALDLHLPTPALHQAAQTASPGGLNGDFCTSANSPGCQTRRVCIQVVPRTSTPGLCTALSRTCVCLPTDPASANCTSSTTCQEGERCTDSGAGDGSRVCFSCVFVRGSAILSGRVVDAGNCGSAPGANATSPLTATPPPGSPAGNVTTADSPAVDEQTPMPTPTPISAMGSADGPSTLAPTSTPGADSLDSMTTTAPPPTPSAEDSTDSALTVPSTTPTADDSDSMVTAASETEAAVTAPAATPAAEESSTAVPPSVIPSATPSATPVVVTTVPTAAPTPDGTAPAAVQATASSSTTPTSAGTTTAAPSPTPPVVPPTPSATPAPCIAAKHLEHLPAHDLVFSAHQRADALCDIAGSCATAGHVVVFRGVAMTMRTYCESHAAGACVAARVLVNSPRMSRQRRVASNTPGLEFTALAARFGSRAEERVLCALVRVGV